MARDTDREVDNYKIYPKVRKNEICKEICYDKKRFKVHECRGEYLKGRNAEENNVTRNG